MRTTITLDPDVAALVTKAMRVRGQSFKEVVNAALRAGLTPGRRPPGYTTPTFRMGFDASVPWDNALQIAAALEDDEAARRLAARK